MKKNSLTSFTQHYAQGLHIEALQSIFHSCKSSLDDHTCETELEHLILNYADSLAFSNNFQEVLRANKALQKQFVQTPTLNAQYRHFLHALKIDHYLLHSLYSSEVYEKILDKNFSTADDSLHTLMQEKYNLLKDFFQPLGIAEEISNQRFQTFLRQANYHKRLKAFKESRHHFYQSLKVENYPYIPLRYPLLGKKTLWESRLSEQFPGTPCILVFPYQMDWEQLSFFLKESRAIFIFLQTSHLLQCLQFPDLLEILRNSKHLLLCLDQPLNNQYKLQPSFKKSDTKLKMMVLHTNNSVLACVPSIQELIKAFIAQPSTELGEETPCSISLYQLGQRLNYQLNLERLGYSRFYALENKMVKEEFYDPYFSTLLTFPHSPAPSREIAASIVLETNPQIKKRPLKKRAPYKIAHILPSHKLFPHMECFKQLQTLLPGYSEQKTFIPFLFTYEDPSLSNEEYPYATHIPKYSQKKELCPSIPHYIIEESKSNTQTARALAELLEKHKIDIAYFHHHSALHLLCARLSSTPLFIQQQSSEHDYYPNFSLIILKNEWELDRWKSKKQNIPIASLPFYFDPKVQWNTKPFSKKYFGLKETDLILTTFSPDLQRTLNKRTCHAIASILKRIPNAYYLPVGYIESTNEIYTIFDNLNVGDRLMFLHEQECPSQLARSMDLYMSEISFTNGIGTLEAMAAGLPIITHYNTTGPYFQREAAYYSGTNLCIKSDNIQDYINLACQLLTDKASYELWKQHSLEQYSKFIKENNYAKQFQKLLFNHIKQIRKPTLKV